MLDISVRIFFSQSDCGSNNSFLFIVNIFLNHSFLSLNSIPGEGISENILLIEKVRLLDSIMGWAVS